MKYTYYALLGLLLGAQGLSAVDAATFDKVIELYKKNEVTTKDVINAYDQLPDKRLGDQLLQVFLRTSINELRREDANRPQQLNTPVPAPINRGRTECAGQGCAARTRRRQPRGPNRRQRRRNRARQEQRDLELAKRRSISTALQELEREEVETAKALSLVEAIEGDQQLSQDIETASTLSLSVATDQEERDLARALAESVNEPQPTHTELPSVISAAELNEQVERDMAIALAESVKTAPEREVKSYKASSAPLHETSTQDILRRAEQAQEPVSFEEEELPARGTPAKRPTSRENVARSTPQNPVEKPLSKDDILEAARAANEGQQPKEQKQVRWADQREESRRSTEEIIEHAEQIRAPQQQTSTPIRRQYVSLDDIIGSTPNSTQAQTEEPQESTTSDILATAERSTQEERQTHRRTDDTMATSSGCTVM